MPRETLQNKELRTLLYIWRECQIFISSEIYGPTTYKIKINFINKKVIHPLLTRFSIRTRVRVSSTSALTNLGKHMSAFENDYIEFIDIFGKQ